MEATIDRMLSKFDKKVLEDYIRDDERDGQIFRHELPKSSYGSKSTMQRINDHRTEVSLPHVESIRLKTAPDRPSTTESVFARHMAQRPPEVRAAWMGVENSSKSPIPKKKKTSAAKVAVFERLSTSTFKPKAPKPKDRPRILPEEEALEGLDEDATIWSAQGGRTLVSELPLATAIPVSLRHVVDSFVRRVLPWQAVLCRRAIENLRDVREQRVNEAYMALTHSMMDKLEEKVTAFIAAKKLQTTQWGSVELERWKEKQNALKQQVDEFLVGEVKRQRDRDVLQALAQGSRDMFLASEIEQAEKRSTHKQLHDAKEACEGEKHVEKRMLAVTINAAHSRADAQSAVVHRTVIKNQEAAHEWLRCVGDNAVTASIVEEAMKKFIRRIRRDKKKIYDYLKETRELYMQQCRELMDSLNIFCEGVVNQATDHICRERLVARAFSIYLMELQTTRSSDMHMDVKEVMNITKHCAKRAEKNEKLTLRRRLQMLSMFDEKRVELCKRVQEQFETANSQLVNNLRSRDAEIEGYVADINYTFRRLVQHSCNRRRGLHTANIAKRQNFFRFEDECVSEIGSLLSNIRLDMEAAWREEYVKAMLVKDSAHGRLRETITNYEATMQSTYENLSCNLKGDRSNIAWVGQAESKLTMKDEERIMNIKQMRRKVSQQWILLLKEALEEICAVMKLAATPPVPDEESTVDFKDVAWADSFSEFGDKCAEIANAFREFTASRVDKERSILATAFAGQREFLERNWKSNIVTMNYTLFAEVKDFFMSYCVAKDNLNDIVLQHEVEAFCYEQGSLMRLDKFWGGVCKQNRVFSEELRETLKTLVDQMSDDSAHLKHTVTRKVIPFETEKSHFSLLGGSAYDIDNFGDRYHTSSSHMASSGGDLSAYLNDIDARQAVENMDRKRSGLLMSLQFDKIDVEKLFGGDTSALNVGPETEQGQLGLEITEHGSFTTTGVLQQTVAAAGEEEELSPQAPIFHAVSEAVRYTVEKIQVSRIRLLLKHIKSELQSLDARDKVRIFQNPSDKIPVFNMTTFTMLSSSDKSPKPVFTAMATAAINCIYQQVAKFCDSARLLDTLLVSLRVSPSVSDTRKDSMRNVFAISFAVNVISQVAQCNRRVDCQQIYEYTRQNIRQLCLTSLHALCICLQRVYDNTQDSPHKTENQPPQQEQMSCSKEHLDCLLVGAHAPRHHGLEDMLRCESSWMLTVLDIDEDFPGISGNSDECVAATTKTFTSLESWTPDQVRAYRLKHTVSVNLLLLCDVMAEVVSTKQINDEDENISSTLHHKGHMHRMTAATDQVTQNMHTMGVPDADICVLVSLLNDEGEGDGPALMDMTLEAVRASVLLWRFVAYAKLHALTQMSVDTGEVDVNSRDAVSRDGHEFDTVLSLLLRHDVFVRQEREKNDNGEFKVVSLSPFEGVGAIIRRLCAVPDVPLSYLQTLTFIADKGSLLCEPWLSEPTNIVNHMQLAPIYEEICVYLDIGLLWGFQQRARDLKSCTSSSAALSPLFTPEAYDELVLLNSGSKENPIPMELLRHYCCKHHPHDVNRCDGSDKKSKQFTSVQVTMRFWSAYRDDAIFSLRNIDTISVEESITKPSGKKATTDKMSDDVGPGRGSFGRYRTTLPEELLRSLPQASDGPEAEDIVRNSSVSVIDLLGVDDSVDSFTDTIGNISSPSSSFLASSLYAATGLLAQPLPSHTQRATIAASIDHHPDLLQPLQNSACIWVFKHAPLHVESVRHMIAFSQNKAKLSPVAKANFAAEHYPSLSEIRRRIELSLLLQFVGEDAYETTSRLLVVDYGDGSSESAGGMGEYWKQLSQNRLKRIGAFTSSARCLLANYWGETLLECRKERHCSRVNAQKDLFTRFRNYVSAYRAETLRQRDVLKELYSHIDKSMTQQQDLGLRMVDAISAFFEHCTDLFVSTLRATLDGYREAKLAFLRQNFSVYENHRAMTNRVHSRCRNALLSLMSGQRDRFDECVLKKLHQYVRASATAGYNQFQRTTDVATRLKNRFLSHITKAWKDINNEVIKSLSHFEGLLGELLVNWYESEKSVDQASRSDHLLLRAEIKVALDNASVTRGEEMKEVLRRYHVLEPHLVAEIFERRVDAVAKEPRGRERGEEEHDGEVRSRGHLDRDDLSSRHLLSESHQSVSVSVSEGHVEDDGGISAISQGAGGNQFDLNAQGKGNYMSMLKELVKAALQQAHQRLEDEKANMCKIVKHNRKKRTRRLEILRENADVIRDNWESIRNDLLALINKYILEARSMKAVCRVDLLEESDKYRKQEKRRIGELKHDVITKNKMLLGLELSAYDEMDAAMFSRYQVEISAIVNNAQRDLIEKKESQPSLLKEFVRDIKARPANMLDKLQKQAFAFYQMYEDDDMVYQFMHTAESMSMCLDDVKTNCLHVMKECKEDQLSTFRRIREESDLETSLGDRIQIRGMLDIMVDCIETQTKISTDINLQESKAQTLNRELDANITTFLKANTLHGELPTEDTLAEFGMCKLYANGHEQHGLCTACVATLYATIHRNDVIVSAKLDAVYSHLAVLEGKEDAVDKAAYAELFEDIAVAHTEVVSEFKGLRSELVSSLREACLARDQFCSSNSLFNEATSSIDDISLDGARDMEAATDAILRAVTSEADVMADLLRRSGAPLRAESNGDVMETASVDVSKQSDELTVSDNMDFVFGNIIGSHSMQKLPLLGDVNAAKSPNKFEDQSNEQAINTSDYDSDPVLYEGSASAASGSVEVASKQSQPDSQPQSSQHVTETSDSRKSEGEVWSGENYPGIAQSDYTGDERDLGVIVGIEGYEAQVDYANEWDNAEGYEGNEEEYQPQYSNPDGQYSGAESQYDGQYDDYTQEAQEETEVRIDSEGMDEEGLLGRGDGRLHESFLGQHQSTASKPARPTSSTPQKVPPLPLKMILPSDSEMRLPYGWEERATDEGTVFYVNTMTNDVSYDVHPSLFMSNGWRKCFTDDWEEYYYNDTTGETTWDPPADAYDDDETHCFQVTSDVEPSLSGSVYLSPRPFNPDIMPTADIVAAVAEAAASQRKPLKLLKSLSSMAYSIEVSAGEGGAETDGSVGGGYASAISAFSYGAMYDKIVHGNSHEEVHRHELVPKHEQQQLQYSQSNSIEVLPGDAESDLGVNFDGTSWNDVIGSVDAGENEHISLPPDNWERHADVENAHHIEGEFMMEANDSEVHDTVSELMSSPDMSPIKFKLSTGHSSNDGEDESERSATGIMLRHHDSYGTDNSVPSSPDKPTAEKRVGRTLKYHPYSSNDGGDDTDHNDDQLHITHHKMKSALKFHPDNEREEEPEDNPLLDASPEQWFSGGALEAEEGAEHLTLTDLYHYHGSGSVDKSFNVDTPIVDALGGGHFFPEDGAELYEGEVQDGHSGPHDPYPNPDDTDNLGQDDAQGNSDEWKDTAGNGTGVGDVGEDGRLKDESYTTRLALGSVGSFESVQAEEKNDSTSRASHSIPAPIKTVSSQEEWMERADTYGMVYYENTVTGEVSWTIPAVSPDTPSPTKKQWQIFFTGDGIPYYFNQTTGESRWHDPMAAQREGADTQLASALAVSPAITPAASPRHNSSSKNPRRTSLSILAQDEDEDNDGDKEEDPYLINLLDFTPKRGSEQKKLKNKSPAYVGNF